MSDLLVLPLLVPLATATLGLAVRRWSRVQVATSVAGVLAYAVSVGLLCWEFVLGPGASGAASYQVGGWSAPFGITLVADALSAFMLVIAAAVAVPALCFSVRFLRAADQQVFYHPLFHFLLLGITGVFLTGDLFNLFVWFEVMLMATYVLVAFYGGPEHTRASMHVLALNVVASAVMLVAIGGLYATTGTLNMADMAVRVGDPAASGVAVGPVIGLSLLLFAVFALKAGLVPFHFWVPGAYAAAPMPATAMFAGATKKVGLYAIVRLYFTVFSEAPVSVDLPLVGGESPLAVLGPVLLAMAAASIALGGLGALYAGSLEEVLAYSSIGQVGFVAIPIALAAAVPEIRHVALLGALVFALHHALTKGMLFLAAGAVRSATGTSRLTALGGLAPNYPVLSGVFFVGAISLVGVPPLSGFFGKFLLFDVAVRGRSGLALALLLAGSFLTIAYATRTWNEGFWDQPSAAVAEGRADPVQVSLLAAMALGVVVVGVGFEPVYQFADLAAEAATDTEGYVDAVAGSGGESA